MKPYPINRDTPEGLAWHRGVVEERMARLASGKEPISTWEEAKQRIREQAEGPVSDKAILS